MQTKNLNDWAIAVVVIVCSIILLGALAIALEGSNLINPGRTLRANFSDITGIQISSSVRFSGAPVGRVHNIRILTAEERATLSDPDQSVQVIMALDPRTPELPANLTASIASDTLLSDKFVLLTSGLPVKELLANDALIDGLAPTTFDELVRTANTTLLGLEGFLGGEGPGKGIDELLASLRTLTADASGAVAELRTLVKNGDGLVTEAGALVADGRDFAREGIELLDGKDAQITALLKRIEDAAAAAESLAKRGDNLLSKNEPAMQVTINDLRDAVENLKLLSAYGTIFTKAVAERPHRLVWGARTPPKLPTPAEILSASGPIANP